MFVRILWILESESDSNNIGISASFGKIGKIAKFIVLLCYYDPLMVLCI